MVNTGLSATENKSKRWSRVPKELRQALHAEGLDIDEHVWKETFDLISSSSPELTQRAIWITCFIGFRISYLKLSSLSKEEFEERFARFWSNIEAAAGLKIPLETDENGDYRGFLSPFFLSPQNYIRNQKKHSRVKEATQ